MKRPSLHPPEETLVAHSISRESEEDGEEGERDKMMKEGSTAESRPTNPLEELVETGQGLQWSPLNAGLVHYRGVFLHEKASLYYSIISQGGIFHFLGFYTSAPCAARAWDLASLKRAIDEGKSLSVAKTNFALEGYMLYENVLGMMVILNFSALVEMLKSMYTAPHADLTEIRHRMAACTGNFPDEEGKVAISSEVKNETPIASPKIRSIAPERLKEVIGTHCARPCVQNEWIKNIRDSRKWKGVYFSRDGVPYSKVEMGGKYHYLGRFDTLEGAARAYDLATLKRSMMNNQSVVILNFSTEDYLKDKGLMNFLYSADSDEVTSFIRMLSKNQRIASSRENYKRGQGSHKRVKLDSAAEGCMSSVGYAGQKRAESAVQHIDWASLGLDSNNGNGSLQEKCPRKPAMQGAQHPQESMEGNVAVAAAAAARAALKNARMELDEDSSTMKRLTQQQPQQLHLHQQEVKIERRVCDENMAALLRGRSGWVRVALNAVALRMTPTTINITEQFAHFPPDIADWFGAGCMEVEGRHLVELVNACGKQCFHFMCYITKDQCRFASTSWNQFIEDIGLALGEVLVLLKTKSSWRLSYAVFMLPDAIMSGQAPQPPPPPPTRLAAMPSAGVYTTSPPLLRAVSGPTMAIPGRRALQAQVLPDAQRLTNIQIVQKTQDKRLLVQASTVSDPTKRGLFIIPSNSVQTSPMARQPPPTGYLGAGMAGHPFAISPQNRRFIYGHPPPPPPPPPVQQQAVMPATVLRSPPLQLRTPPPARPACFPTAPIRLNVRGGYKALTRSDGNMFVVMDPNGQTRLVTSQSVPNHPGMVQNSSGAGGVLSNVGLFAQQPQPQPQQHIPMEFEMPVPIVGGPQGYGERQVQNAGRAAVGVDVQVAGDRTSQTSPEITVIDPSPTTSEATGPDPATVVVVDPSVEAQDDDEDAGNKLDHQDETSEIKPSPETAESIKKDTTTSAGNSASAAMMMMGATATGGEDQRTDSLPNMYGQVTRILEACQGLPSDIAKKYKFAFVNKMSHGQQVANFMELKNLSDAGEWDEVIDWIDSTVNGTISTITASVK